MEISFGLHMDVSLHLETVVEKSHLDYISIYKLSLCLETSLETSFG